MLIMFLKKCPDFITDLYGRINTRTREELKIALKKNKQLFRDLYKTFKVKALLKKKVVRKKVDYLMKWTGYNAAFDK